MITVYLLWLLAFALWVIGDNLTTYYCLRRFGLEELNPAMAFVIKRWGIKGLTLLKIATFVCFVSLALLLPQRPSIYHPFIIILIGTFLTLFNLSSIISAQEKKSHIHD